MKNKNDKKTIVNQKLTSQLFLLIALAGSFFLSYSCECEEDLDRPEVALDTTGPEALAEGGPIANFTLTFSMNSAPIEDLMLSFTISGEGITRDDFTLTPGEGLSAVTFIDDGTLSGTLIIEMGSANASLTLTASDDALDERVEETLTFTLNESDAYMVNPSERAKEITLIDNENTAEVTGLSSHPSSLAITLTWTDPDDRDLAHVEISWMPAPDDSSSPQQITKGVQTLTIPGLISETIYAFAAIGVDSAGNRSPEVRIDAIPLNLLTNVHNVPDSGDLELNGVSSMTTASVGGMNYLFVAGNSDHGVSVFRVENNGNLVNTFNISDDGPGGNLKLNGAASVTTASVGETYLFVAGGGDSAVSVFRVENNGILVSITNVSDTDDLNLNGVNSVTTALVGETNYLFVAGWVDDGVSVFSVQNDGNLNNVYNVSDTGSFELDGAGSVTTALVGRETYLFVAGSIDDGVSVFQVQSDGTLSNVHNVSDTSTLELNRTISLATASVGGETYLFAAGNHDHGLSVFRVENDGILVSITNVSDSDSLNLRTVRSLTSASVGGTIYLFVVGEIDSGITVFRVENDGILVNVENVSDSESLELSGAYFVTTASVGGETYLFAGGNHDDGVSVFRVGLSASN